jgi:hypothetical protein
MDIGKSTKRALLDKGKTVTWLATQLECSRNQASLFANSKRANGTTIERLSAVFEMKASEFIALGE